MKDNVADMDAARRRRRGQQELPEWTEHANRSATGALIAELANVAIALKHDPDLRNLFAFDEFSQQTILMPSFGNSFHNGRGGPLTDTVVAKLQERLQNEGLARIHRDTVHQAIDLHASQFPVHPLRDWLGGLEWDGVARVVDWLSFYLGAARTPYTNEVGRMFLISMVARVFRPGCKADHMLVVEGPQGILKSTALRTLSGDEYFSDSLPDISTNMKDARAHLHGKWLIEIAELASFNRAEAAHLKSFLTCQTDIFRPPYGRLDVQKPRSCVFAGSTNEKLYLKDQTGGRRFWPVKCGEIDIDALIADRGALFAEAVRLYEGGIKWWPDRDFEQQHIEAEQQSRREMDPWVETIGGYVEQRQAVTIMDIQVYALDIKSDRMSTRDRNRIVACLEELGWHATAEKHFETRRTLYRRH